MKLIVKDNKYYKLKIGSDIILFDDFEEAVEEMKQAVIDNIGEVNLQEADYMIDVKSGGRVEVMNEVSYKKLFNDMILMEKKKAEK